MSQSIITVSTLVHYLKQKIDNDNLIQKILVEGEISNFSNYRSGHWYFSLKDENSVVRCAMFSSNNKKVAFMPKDGDKVIVKADVSVYEQRGELQLIVTDMKADRVGDLYLQYEALKKKLFDEGLFSEDHKKDIPQYPFNIALVTGANTAARSDVLTTLKRRWPIAKIYEFNVLVQGSESASQIINALNAIDQMNLDVILLVRGGGSIEDLWSFNDESLARTIFNLNTPIITGIGHEINFTIADYVADLRAPTPTGAAERCSPNIKDIIDIINNDKIRLNNAINNIINIKKNKLDALGESYVLNTPYKLYSDKEIHLNELSKSLNHHINYVNNNMSNRLTLNKNILVKNIKNNDIEIKNKLDVLDKKLYDLTDNTLANRKYEFNNLVDLLDAYSPLKSLQRGYSIIQKDDKLIKKIDELSIGDTINVTMSDGKIVANITNINKGDKSWLKKK